MSNVFALVKDGATHNVVVWDGDVTYKAALEAQGFALVPAADAPPMQTPSE